MNKTAISLALAGMAALPAIGQARAAAFVPQCVRELANRLTFAVGLVAIGEGRQQGDGENGLLFLGLHGGGDLSCR